MRNNVNFSLSERIYADLKKRGGPPHNGGGSEPPMDTRIAKLESDVHSIKTDISILKTDIFSLKTGVAVLRSNYATKENLHKEINSQTWKLVTFVCGFGGVLTAAVYFIAKQTT